MPKLVRSILYTTLVLALLLVIGLPSGIESVTAAEEKEANNYDFNESGPRIDRS